MNLLSSLEYIRGVHTCGGVNEVHTVKETVDSTERGRSIMDSGALRVVSLHLGETSCLGSLKSYSEARPAGARTA